MRQNYAKIVVLVELRKADVKIGVPQSVSMCRVKGNLVRSFGLKRDKEKENGNTRNYGEGYEKSA